MKSLNEKVKKEKVNKNKKVKRETIKIEKNDKTIKRGEMREKVKRENLRGKRDK